MKQMKKMEDGIKFKGDTFVIMGCFWTGRTYDLKSQKWKVSVGIERKGAIQDGWESCSYRGNNSRAFFSSSSIQCIKRDFLEEEQMKEGKEWESGRGKYRLKVVIAMSAACVFVSVPDLKGNFRVGKSVFRLVLLLSPPAPSPPLRRRRLLLLILQVQLQVLLGRIHRWAYKRKINNGRVMRQAYFQWYSHTCYV